MNWGLGINLIAKDSASSTLNRVSRSFNTLYGSAQKNIGIMGRVGGALKAVAGKSWRVVLSIKDNVSGALGRLRSALFSFQGMATVALGAMGVSKLTEATVGAALTREKQMLSIEHFLKGNKQKAQQYMKWLENYAANTPFEMSDIMPAASRALGISDGDIKKASAMTKLAGDMAALTPGKSVADAMEALADAQMGEFERLKEFNVKLTKEEMQKLGGFSGVLKKLYGNFGGGADKLSKTVSGRLSTISDTMGNLFLSAGQGILSAIGPRIEKIAVWLDQNKEKVAAWRDALVKFGAQAMEGVLGFFERGFEHIRTKYLDNPAFADMSFMGKFKFVLDDLSGLFEGWWSESGAGLAGSIGAKLGKGLLTGVVEAVKGGISGLADMWGGVLKAPSMDSFGNAAMVTGAAGIGGAMLLSPLLDAGKSVAALGGPIMSGLGDAFSFVGKHAGDLKAGFDLCRESGSGMLSSLVGGAQMAFPALGNLVSKIGGLGTSLVQTVIPAVMSFSTALLTNPVTLVIAGLVALGAALYALWKNWDDVKTIVLEWYGVVTEKLAAAQAWVAEKVAGITQWFSGLGASIASSMSGVGEAIMAPFRGAIDWIMGRFEALKGAWDSVVGFFSSSSSTAAPAGAVGTPVVPGPTSTIDRYSAHATGGIFGSPHLGMVAEAGAEAIIPLSAAMRGRGTSLWMQAGQRLGFGAAALLAATQAGNVGKKGWPLPDVFGTSNPGPGGPVLMPPFFATDRYANHEAGDNGGGSSIGAIASPGRAQAVPPLTPGFGAMFDALQPISAKTPWAQSAAISHEETHMLTDVRQPVNVQLDGRTLAESIISFEEDRQIRRVVPGGFDFGSESRW